MSALLLACAVPEELVSPVQPWQWVLPPVNGREVHLGEETNLGPLPPYENPEQEGSILHRYEIAYYHKKCHCSESILQC
jgi:hypothetical protein